MRKQLTAIIEREGDGYVSLCPEVDVASQGATIEEARDNLREALELFFESASPDEINQRLHEEVFVRSAFALRLIHQSNTPVVQRLVVLRIDLDGSAVLVFGLVKQRVGLVPSLVAINPALKYTGRHRPHWDDGNKL